MMSTTTKVPWNNNEWTWAGFALNVNGTIKPTQNFPPVPYLWEYGPVLVVSKSGETFPGITIAKDQMQLTMEQAGYGYLPGWWNVAISFSYDGTTLTTKATVVRNIDDGTFDTTTTLTASQSVSSWSKPVSISLSTSYDCSALKMGYSNYETPLLTPYGPKPSTATNMNIDLTLTLSSSGWDVAMSPFYWTKTNGDLFASMTDWGASNTAPKLNSKKTAPAQFISLSQSTTGASYTLNPYTPSIGSDFSKYQILGSEGTTIALNGAPYNASFSANLETGIIGSILQTESSGSYDAFTGGQLTAYNYIQQNIYSQYPTDSADRGSTYSDPAITAFTKLIQPTKPSAATGVTQQDWTDTINVLNPEITGWQKAQQVYQHSTTINTYLGTQNADTLQTLDQFFNLTTATYTAPVTINWFDLIISAVEDIVSVVSAAASVAFPEAEPFLSVAGPAIDGVLGMVQAAHDDIKSSTSAGNNSLAIDEFISDNYLATFYQNVTTSTNNIYTSLTSNRNAIVALGEVPSGTFNLSATDIDNIQDALAYGFKMKMFIQIAQNNMSLQRYQGTTSSNTDFKKAGGIPNPTAGTAISLSGSYNGSNDDYFYPYGQSLKFYHVTDTTGNPTSPAILAFGGSYYFFGKVIMNQGNGDKGVYNASKGPDGNLMNLDYTAYEWLVEGISGGNPLTSAYDFYNLNVCKLPINSGLHFPEWPGWAG